MVDVKKFSNIDLYGLIGVEFNATESEVNKLLLSVFIVNCIDKKKLIFGFVSCSI